MNPGTNKALTGVQAVEFTGVRTTGVRPSTSDQADGFEAVTAGALPQVLPPGAVRHSCGAWWTGSRTAHCGSCHRSFSSLTAFETHQRGGRPGAMCRVPESVGLVPVRRPYGVLWSCPAREGGNPHARRGGGE